MKASESPSANADLVLFTAKDQFTTRPFRASEFDGELGSSALYHAEDRLEIHIGLGQQESLSGHSYRLAAAHAARKATAAGSTEIALDISETEEFVSEIAEGLLMGFYRFDQFRSDTPEQSLKKVTLVGPKKTLKSTRAQIARGIAIGSSISYCRELGNLPGNEIYPEKLALEARQIAESDVVKCKIWNLAGLKREHFGGIVAVGAGSANEPRLIRLDYNSGSRGVPTVAVVGKAITFDSGGLCIKPGEHMDEMKFDKMGGCAVLGVLRAVLSLKTRANVIGILAAAENMTGSSAYRPGDILRSYDGKTIEVANTDAEGRIVLADALGYVREKVKPDLVIDLATLTGACVVALGEERAGLFSKDETISQLLCSVGDQIGEKVWPLPVGDEFDEMITSKVADVRNLGSTRWGGASTAASFLLKWTDGLKHVHLDIAGPAMSSKERFYRSEGASGFGVNLVVRFIEKWAESFQNL